jgi:hypothetical protein
MQLLNEQYSNEPSTVRVYGRGTGATTSSLTSVKGKGIASIARTGVGAHTITFSDRWQGLLNFTFTVLDAGTVDDWEVTPIEDALLASKTLKIVVFKGGTATDLPVTAKLLFEVVVSNTSQKPAGF